MRKDDDDICTLTRDDIHRPPDKNLFVWRDAVRHHNAQVMLARQAALAAAGPMHDDYFRKHRSKLLREAADIIASRPGYARWRFRH
jgi:hypothetical protein